MRELILTRSASSRRQANRVVRTNPLDFLIQLDAFAADMGRWMQRPKFNDASTTYASLPQCPNIISLTDAETALRSQNVRAGHATRPSALGTPTKLPIIPSLSAFGMLIRP